MRRFTVTVLLGVLLVAAVVSETRFNLFSDLFQGECSTSICCEDCRVIRVERVIDGDTFDSPEGRVRLFGVDTPERNESCYSEASNRLSQFAGNSVRVEPGPRASDRNGRLLFYVYTRSGESIDEILVREGLGLAWTRDGQHRDLLIGLERQTQRKGTGCLWR